MSLAARCIAFLVAGVLLVVTPFTWLCLPAWGPTFLNRVRRDLIRWSLGPRRGPDATRALRRHDVRWTFTNRNEVFTEPPA